MESNKRTEINIKQYIYKSVIKPIRAYGLSLWGSDKMSNLNKIQRFRNIILQKKKKKMTDSPPSLCFQLQPLHRLAFKTVQEEAVNFYKRFLNSRLNSHPNPLILNL